MKKCTQAGKQASFFKTVTDRSLKVIAGSEDLQPVDPAESTGTGKKVTVKTRKNQVKLTRRGPGHGPGFLGACIAQVRGRALQDLERTRSGPGV